MATPNYGYEKRQKELAKKRKKEDKLKAKAEKNAHGDQQVDGDADQGAPAVPGVTQPTDGGSVQA